MPTAKTRYITRRRKRLGKLTARRHGLRKSVHMTSINDGGIGHYSTSGNGKALNMTANDADDLPFPNKIICRHRYCQTFTLDGGVGSASSFSLGLNNLYEPIAAGHQPMGFDQMSALYQKYKVLGAKVTATFANVSNTLDTGNQYVGLQIHENSSYTPSYISQIVERGRCAYKLLGLANGGHDTCTLTVNWSGKEWYGKNNYSGQDVAGSVSSNPSESCYVAVFSAADYDGQNPGGCDVMVRIDYIVEWFGPIQMNQS